jgi:hypothetical protein
MILLVRHAEFYWPPWPWPSGRRTLKELAAIVVFVALAYQMANPLFMYWAEAGNNVFRPLEGASRR